MKGKLRYYYRVDDKGTPIPGSNTSARRMPYDSRHYKEISLSSATACCTIPATADGGIYYIRINHQGYPIAGSLQLGRGSSYGWQNIDYYCCKAFSSGFSSGFS